MNWFNSKGNFKLNLNEIMKCCDNKNDSRSGIKTLKLGIIRFQQALSNNRLNNGMQ
jgi:hypothetical protein